VAQNAIFASKIKLFSKDVCCKVSLCGNFQRQCGSYIIPLSNGPQTDCRRRPHLFKIYAQSDPALQKTLILTDLLNSAAAVRATEKI